MKKTLIAIIKIAFIIFLIATIIVACNYTSNGEFGKTIPLILILMVSNCIICGIATHNTRKAQKEKRKKQLRRKKELLNKKKQEEYKNACIQTAIESYKDYESPEAYWERLRAQEERALYLTSQGLQDLI